MTSVICFDIADGRTYQFGWHERVNAIRHLYNGWSVETVQVNELRNGDYLSLPRERDEFGRPSLVQIANRRFLKEEVAGSY